MAAKIFFPYAITLDSGTDVVIDGVSSCSINEGGQIQRPNIDGLVDPRLSFISGYNQAIDFTTMTIGRMLTMLSNSTDCMSGKQITGTDALLMYSQKAKEGGTRYTTSVNEKYTINEALMVPVSIEAGNDGNAMITVNIVPVHDGTNTPIVRTANQALPALTASDEVYFLGSATINGTAVAVQSLSIRFGISVQAVKDSGLADATMVYIANRMPVISITTTDIDFANTLARGVAISSSTKVYLRAGTKSGSRQADNATVHPCFTVNAGTVIRGALTGSPQSATIEIHPTFDGTNAIIAYSVGAIT